MNRQQLTKALLSTLDDHRLSRGERSAARQLLDEHRPSASLRRALANELTQAVGDRMGRAEDRDAVTWLGDLLPLLLVTEQESTSSRAWFGPEDPMVETLVSQLRSVRDGVDVAVFTLTDDRLTAELIALHERGARVRVLTDDDKSADRGSDIDRLLREGLDVRMDRSEHHFHHKFAVLDGERLLNGSYNWTRGADRHNRENFLVTDDPGLVRAYEDAFETLWNAFSG